VKDKEDPSSANSTPTKKDVAMGEVPDQLTIGTEMVCSLSPSAY